MADFDLAPSPANTYGYAFDHDMLEYSIHSLAATAAWNNIRNYISDFDLTRPLKEHALHSFLTQFNLDQSDEGIQKELFRLRDKIMDNIFVCKDWDTIKCFLRLMTCSGVPCYVTDYALDDPLVTKIVFKNFSITKTIYDDWDETRYTINKNYQQLRLILSGDIETNPGPTVNSKPLSDIQQKKINEMRREIEKLKKAQQQHNNFVQRRIELEKRDRKKKRLEASTKKRHAQTLFDATLSKMRNDFVSTCSSPTAMAEAAKTSAYVMANAVLPGSGTAAATIVNGAKLSAAVDKLNPTMDMVQSILKTLTSATDELRKMFKVPDGFDLLGIVISLSAVANNLKEGSPVMLAIHCANLARLLGISIDSLVNLVPSMSDVSVYFSSGNTTARVGQSLVSDLFTTASKSPELLPFAGFLSFLCGVFSLLCSGTLPSPSEMTKHFASVGRAAQGFRALKDLFNWVFDYLAQIYYTTVYGISAEEYQFMQNFPQLENLYAACCIIEKFDNVVVDSSGPIAEQIVTVYLQLSDYHTQATRMNSRHSVSLVDSLKRRINKQYEWALHCAAKCHTIRSLPMSLYLYGQPGVGKSVATDVLKAQIFRKYLKKNGTAFESCSFPRMAQNEYWEGYTGQPIVILDDFGNVKDSLQKPVEEYGELERMVNTAQYPLKMAELSKKGCSNFTSDFIIASSNQQFPDIHSLVDPGAVFRRFHIWAEVTIDPKFGVPIGRDHRGDHYYTFSKEKVAQHKGIKPEDVEPLTTEHYRFTCYKVTHNKARGSAEVTLIPKADHMTFDQFWNFYVAEYDKRKEDSDKLANAVRRIAGIDTPAPPSTERQILEKFDRIFRPEKFIEVLADDEKYVVEGDEDVFEDAVEDHFFGSLSHLFQAKHRIRTITAKFASFKDECSRALGTWMSKMYACVSAATNKLLSVAEFLLSFFSAAAQKTINYLPRVPTSDILTGICSTAIALLGIWYSGIFCSQPSNTVDSWCQFNREPSNSTVPCGKCKACSIIEYPNSGDMLAHFLDRTGIKSVRSDLLKSGFDAEAFADIREKVRRTRPKERPRRQCAILRYTRGPYPQQSYEEAQELLSSACLAGCFICDSLEIDNLDMNDSQAVLDCVYNLWESHSTHAQRVYDSQPRVPPRVNYAQKVYEHQPAVARQRTFAQNGPQGFINCETEMHIGARKYAQRDQVQIEQTTQVLLRNSVWIQAVDKNGMCCRSNGVFLVGRTMITTAHTVLNPPHIDPIEYLVIRNPYSTKAAIQVPISECQISQMFQMDGAPVDLALVSFPPVVPNRPKILSKFLSATDIDLLQEGDMTFSGFYEVNGKTIVQEKYPSSFAVSTRATEYFLHPPGTCPKDTAQCKCPIRIGNHIDYDLETVSGMCGALLSISNKMIHTKLIGFHVAGGAGVSALGALTTKEFLDQGLKEHVKKFNISSQYLIDGRLPYSQSWVSPEFQVSLLDEGDCINVGTAPAPNAPIHTALLPSIIFDKVQKHKTKPALLKPTTVAGEVLDPMLKGIKKIMGGQTWVDADLLEAAANDVFQGLGKPPTGMGQVHTYEEAITGVHGDQYKRPINRTTSPGYPYNLNNKGKGKTDWLGDGEQYIVDHPGLKRDVENLIEDSRNGIRGSAISTATLKDEKRDINKVNAGKTRVFEACPQHLVIALRQYYLDFNAHVTRHRIKNGIAVGINPYSLECTTLAHHLQEKGNYMIAGDFSNFDGSLLMQVLVKINEKINEWYDDGEENKLIRAALWDHICNADILVRGEVIRKTHSQPSGNPLTVIVNSLFNGIVMRIAYLMLKKQQGLPAICDYRKHVAEIIYGDDDIKSVSIEILDWFNQNTLTEALASFGLTYTDEAKTGVILPFKPLEDVAFLKRQFVIQPDGTFLAPMNLEAVLEITNWIRGKARRAATVENCQQVIMELAMHKREVYDYWSRRVRDELSDAGINFSVPTHYEQMEVYRCNRDLYSRQEYVPLW